MQETVTVFLTGMSHDGRAVGKIGDAFSPYHGAAVFVQNAIVGQTVKAVITAKKKNFLEAVCIELVENSPYFTEGICPHHNDCGGCSWQHIGYERQLSEKENFVRNSLRKIAKISDSELEKCFYPILSCKDITENSTALGSGTECYRNKMEFAFALCGGQLKLGLRKKNSHEIAEVTHCSLMPLQAMEILSKLRSALEDFALPFYRYAVIRYFQNIWTLELITRPFSKKNKEVEKESIERCFQAVKAVADGVMHSIRKAETDVAYGETVIRECGNTALTAKLDFLSHSTCYQLGNRAFFQVNTIMTEILYSVVHDFAKCILPEKNGQVWDFYCGVGSIGLSVAPFCVQNGKQTVFPRFRALSKSFSSVQYKKPLLLGVEAVESAVGLAKENAAANGCDFAYFECSAGKNLGKYFKRFSLPNLLILDPPRSGIEDEAIEAVLDYLPPYLVLVSCNPATLARDIGKLCPVYALIAVQPVDLFPHTPHTETAVLLAKK